MEDSKVKAAMQTVCALALLAMAVVPASADLYSNGPINGTLAAYDIFGGQSISDSFVLSSASTVTGVDFGAWTGLGDSITSVQWSIGTTPGDSSLGGGVANTTDVLFSNSNGYTVDTDTFSTGSISLGAGTYYLTLQNSTTASGNSEGFWDINNGPSSGYFDGANPLANDLSGCTTCSEAFGIQGTGGTVTPEPGYWALLSVAVVGLIWVKRRRARVQA